MSTKVILTAAEKTIRTLTTTAANAQKEMTALTALIETVPAIQEQVAEAEAKLKGIKEETALAIRDAKVERDMAIREDEDKVLTNLLDERELAYIAKDELTLLEARLVRDEDEAKADIAKAVNAAVAAAKSTHDLEMLKASGDWKVEKAQLQSAADNATSKIEMLEAQVAQLQETIRDERQARIDIAASESQKQGVVVNNGK